MCRTIKGWSWLLGALIAGSLAIWSVINGYLVQSNGYTAASIGMYFLGLVFLTVAKYFYMVMKEDDKMPEKKKKR